MARTIRRGPCITRCACGRVFLGRSRRGGRGWRKWAAHMVHEHPAGGYGHTYPMAFGFIRPLQRSGAR